MEHIAAHFQLPVKHTSYKCAETLNRVSVESFLGVYECQKSTGKAVDEAVPLDKCAW